MEETKKICVDITKPHWWNFRTHVLKKRRLAQHSHMGSDVKDFIQAFNQELRNWGARLDRECDPSMCLTYAIFESDQECARFILSWS